MKTYTLQTKLRDGIKDVQGDAILNVAARDLKITHITVGQVFYITVEDDVNIDDIAHIFVNDLLYDYTVTGVQIC
tara:strand:+ start:57 stop:281 length:225 start_codon:yes stop_codon:yes gene_type:complete